MAHWLPIHWWKSIGPWVVCAVKLGASSLIRNDMAPSCSRLWLVTVARCERERHPDRHGDEALTPFRSAPGQPRDLLARFPFGRPEPRDLARSRSSFQITASTLCPSGSSTNAAYPYSSRIPGAPLS